MKIIANDEIADGSPCAVTTVDYGGKTYNTIQIGDQCWLKENLDVGMRINSSVDQTNNGTIEKWCYDEDPANCATYGGYYRWEEAMQYVTTQGTQGICPDGWHIPTKAEYEILKSVANDDSNVLKKIGQGSSAPGTNTSGFSTLLSGHINYWYEHTNIAIDTYLWTTTREAGSSPYGLYLHGFNSAINLYATASTDGNCVRCVKD